LSGFRSKLIFLLIVYFAGFSTAIYTLAPAPEYKGQPTLCGYIAAHSDNGARITRHEVVESFNTGMHKCVDFGKEAALRTARFLKDKFRKMRDA